MKEIIVRVPDQKLDFILQLIEHLGLETSSESLEIPEEHKSIVRERINSSNPENLVPWDKARKQFSFNSKV